ARVTASARSGSAVRGVFGLLAGSALLFVPGVGPLIVLGPLAAAAVGAVQGALVAGGGGAILGHFVAERARLSVAGPRAAAAVGAVQGAVGAGGVGAILGHFVAKRHIPKYEQLV